MARWWRKAKEEPAPEAADEAQASEEPKPVAPESAEPPASPAPAEAATAATADAPDEPATTDAPDEPLAIGEAQGWNGHTLDDMGGATVGKIEGVYVDEDSGEPEWLLARMGRFGHHCLVPARDAVAAAGHVWVPYTRDQIRKAPRVDGSKPLQRQAEQQLLDYFGVGTGQAGRGAALAERDESAITARPAVS